MQEKAPPDGGRRRVMCTETLWAGLLLATASTQLASCATPGRPPLHAAPAVEEHVADEQPPDLRAFEVGPPREAYYDALSTERNGDAAAQAHDDQRASADYRKAAEGYLAFVHSFGGSGWDLTLRYHAADLYFRAGDVTRATDLARHVAGDPRADARSRAVARLLEANAEVKAGTLAALRMVPAEERHGAPPAPRAPPGAWKEFVQATEAYLRAPSQGGVREPTRPSSTSAAQLALAAAQVEFATDNMVPARELLREILDRWPHDAGAFAKAAPLYLETFLVTGDEPGYAASLDRVGDQAQRETRIAPEQEEPGYARVLDTVQRAQARLRYRAARDALDHGNAADAARMYETLATAPASDPSVALSDAALAWERAGDDARAMALRERILRDYPESKSAMGAALALASERSTTGKHSDAARLYATAAQRAAGPTRCLALRNGAIESERAEAPEAAASLYLAFGRDASCAKASPDVAAIALYRAGTLLQEAHRPAEARDAFHAAAALDGVSGAEAKRLVNAAKRQLRER
jgi:hypothetical protein